MKAITCFILILYGGLLFCSSAPDTLYILETTDIHGFIYPYDYINDTEFDGGLARIYTLVKKYRARSDKVILLDGGDMLQGTPLADYYNKILPADSNPFIEIMNFMEYDAFTVGNHDIEQGQEIYDRARAQSHFPWLAANALLAGGSVYFDPYIIINLNGVRIGILGLTTPSIPSYMDESFYPGIIWGDMVPTAEKYASLLRPNVDILVGLFHAGFIAEEPLCSPVANASGIIAEQTPGFDIICAGHSHRPLPLEFTETKGAAETARINAGDRGKYLGIVRIIYQQDDSGFKMISRQTWLESATQVEPAAEILDIALPYHKATLTYINTILAYTEEPLSTYNAWFQDNPLVDMINLLQLHITQADISFTTCFDTAINIEPGPVLIKHAYALYPYYNFLYTMKLNGQQIKDYLEYSARFYQVVNDTLRAVDDIPGYYCDFAEGISYYINPEESYGNRIIITGMDEGSMPFALDRQYTVAMNSFRASGGGGFITAIKASSQDIIYRNHIDITSLIIEHLRSVDKLVPQITRNWEIRY